MVKTNRWARRAAPLLAVVLCLGMSAVSGAATVTPPSKASTSARGVTSKAINVAFPVVNLNSLTGRLGFAEDAEYGEQTKAIHLFVNQINDSGGINGRKINPVISFFDPTDENGMRAICKDWTEGTPPIFAVLDGVGTWNGDNELCVTQEGHTPFIGQWTTVSNYTQLGSPYLWWTGPDDAAILQAVVSWGKSAGTIGGKAKLGIIAGDRASDQTALNQYLLPDLKKIGVTPVVETIAAEPSETAQTNSDAPLIVEKLRSAGVTSVIPLVPFNALSPVISAENQQQWYPKLLLSDYENSIEAGLGFIGPAYDKALDGQEGVTVETLGGIDDPRPEAEGGYDPGVRACWNTWHKAYPEIPPGNMNDDIEEQGPVQGWCQEIRLFADAATAAGKDLNRRTFVTALSKITNYPGGYSPVLSFGPDKFYGPTEYRIVSLHDNAHPSSLCKLPAAPLKPQGRCWVVMQNWKPLPKVS